MLVKDNETDSGNIEWVIYSMNPLLFHVDYPRRITLILFFVVGL